MAIALAREIVNVVVSHHPAWVISENSVRPRRSSTCSSVASTVATKPARAMTAIATCSNGMVPSCSCAPLYSQPSSRQLPQSAALARAQALALALCGCLTHGGTVLPVGPDTYSVSQAATSFTQSKEAALAEAGQYCANLHKQISSPMPKRTRSPRGPVARPLSSAA